MRRTFPLIVFIIILLFNVPARAQSTNPEAVTKAAIAAMPREAKTTADFVPANWEIISEGAGDLNGDGLADYVMDVSPKPVEDQGTPPDIVVVLLAEAGGRYRRFAVNDGLSTTSGFDGRPYRIEIKNGVLVLNENFGNGEATDITFRFRYDAAARKLMLIGFDYESYSRPGMHDAYATSENYLTGVRIETVRHLETRKNSDALYGSETSKRKTIKRVRIPFEEARLNEDENGGETRPF